MNSTTAIFDFITLEVEKKRNSLLTNIWHETCFYDIKSLHYN